MNGNFLTASLSIIYTKAARYMFHDSFCIRLIAFE